VWALPTLDFSPWQSLNEDCPVAHAGFCATIVMFYDIYSILSKTEKAYMLNDIFKMCNYLA